MHLFVLWCKPVFIQISNFWLFFTAYYRFVVLFFNCLLTFGSYFCFDIPSVLQDQFQGVSVSKRELRDAPTDWSIVNFTKAVHRFVTGSFLSNRTWRVPIQQWLMGRLTVCWDWGWARSSTTFFMPSMPGRKIADRIVIDKLFTRMLNPARIQNVSLV